MLARKLIRDLYGSRGLLLAITCIIAVGVMCFVSMQSAYRNLHQAKTRYYRQCRMADFWIDLKKVPLAELDSLSRLPGIALLHPRIQFLISVDLPNVEKPINGMVISLPDRRRPILNDVVIRQGGYFTARRANEVIVNQAFAERHGLRPGQWIHVVLNNRRQQLLVVGTALSSEFTYLVGAGSIMPDPEHFGVLYLKQSFAEDVFDFQDAANSIVGYLAAASPIQRDVVLRRADLVLEPYGVFRVTPLSEQLSNQLLSSEIDGLGAFATVVPTIFLIVAALVLNVLLTRLARQQRVVVGTLKALGYTDGQVFRHFLVFGLSVGLAGGLAGSVLGYLASSGMTIVYRKYFEFPDLRSGFYWHTHAVGMSVSLTCALLGSLYAARSMLRLQPAEAMRGERPRRGGAVWLERFPSLWQRLDATWRLVLRGLLRSRMRTAVTVFAATMGAGLLVSGFMMIQAQHHLLDFQFERVVRSDIDVAFEEERGWEAWLEMRRMPGVDYAEPTLDVACTLVNGPYRKKGGITGLLPTANLTVPRDLQGRPLRLPETGLILSRQLGRILHVEPGQQLTVIPVKGLRQPVTVLVASITDSYIGLAAYANIHYLSRLMGESFAITGVQLVAHSQPRYRAALNQHLKRTPGIQTVVARRDLIQNLSDTLLTNQYVFIALLVVFSGVIFFGSIVNASIVNLAERQREVATFLALGYSPWQVGGMFLRESLVANLFGALLGLPLGYGLVVLTAWSFNTDFLRLPVITAPWVWCLTVLLSVVFTLLAHVVVQRNIHSMAYLEALKVQE